MRTLLTLALVILSLSAFSIPFNSLSSENGVTVIYNARENSHVDVNLSLIAEKANRNSVSLKLRLSIGDGICLEYRTIESLYSGVIKQIFLNEGEQLKVELFLHEQGRIELLSLEGDLSLERNTELKIDEEFSNNRFFGDIWSDKQLPLFRVSKDSAGKEMLTLKFEFTDQFEYDKLFFRLKVISPVDGILLYEKDLEILAKDSERRRRSIEMEFEDVPIEEAGSYYYQVSHRMNSPHVNGVSSINFNLSPL
jgi:hypothetical protein